MRILVSGSHGLIGSALIPFLRERGHDGGCIVSSAPEGGDVRWDPAAGTIDAEGLEGWDAVVHLAGEPLMGRWTARKQERIRSSRVDGTRLLCEALAKRHARPRVLLMASGVGFYGDRSEAPVDEEAGSGEGFLASLCVAWEGAAHVAEAAGIRVVPLRLGVVLSAKGGALAQMLPAFRWGLGGVLGKGTQRMSWVALDDVLRVVDFALASEVLDGPVNVAAPGHVANREVARTLARVLRRPAPWRVPAFALRLMWGRLADELLLSGVGAEPKRLLGVGFAFEWPDLEGALRHVLSRSGPTSPGNRP